MFLRRRHLYVLILVNQFVIMLIITTSAEHEFQWVDLFTIIAVLLLFAVSFLGN